MSGLGLLATAFGSYASTLGGLYKEQVEKEQAAQEKLAAEEREFKRQLALKDIEEQYKKAADDRALQRNLALKATEHEYNIKEEKLKHTFAIDLLKIKFAQDVKLEQLKQSSSQKSYDQTVQNLINIKKAQVDAIKAALAAGKLTPQQEREAIKRLGNVLHELQELSQRLGGSSVPQDSSQQPNTSILSNTNIPFNRPTNTEFVEWLANMPQK